MIAQTLASGATDAAKREALLTEMERLSDRPALVRRVFTRSTLSELEALLVQMRHGRAAIDAAGPLGARWDDSRLDPVA